MANQKSTYKYWQPCIPRKITDIIIQNNYHRAREIGSRVAFITGNQEKDEDELNCLIDTNNTVAIFRFKPKAKAIDLGELESRINGQSTQAKKQFMAMPKENRRECVNSICKHSDTDNYMFFFNLL